MGQLYVSPGRSPRCYTQVGIALLTVQLASLGSKNKEMVHAGAIGSRRFTHLPFS